MPDVAMATASLGQLQLGDPPESLQLDLGDGPSHMMGGASGIGVLGIQVGRIFHFLQYSFSASPLPRSQLLTSFTFLLSVAKCAIHPRVVYGSQNLKHEFHSSCLKGKCKNRLKACLRK